jgi:AP-4 complex subunit mu-1
MVINSSIDGVIQMKSYLHDNPDLRLVLNNDLQVGRSIAGPTGSITLDDCNFHECVDLKDFEAMKTLVINPPDGEFLVMNYRINGEFPAPFRMYPFIDEISPFKLQLTVKVRSSFPPNHFATGVVIKFPVPRTSNAVTHEMPKKVQGQSFEYKKNENCAYWTINKF